MAKKPTARALFAANLARLRNDVGWPQKHLAEKAGLTHNFINDLENKKKSPSFETIDKLSEALGAEPMHFFVNPAQWGNAEKQKYLALLDGMNANIKRIFDNYKEMVSAPKGR